MSVTLSVATSADGYIDDCSAERLVISSPQDWAEVYSLRAYADAILIGGQTLRQDNPRLTIKSQSLIDERIARSMPAEPARVRVSGKSPISPSLRIFGSGGGRIIIFSNVERPELEHLAEIITLDEITASSITVELERRGISNLFVEGGAKILDMFLRERVVNYLRLASNPEIVVADPLAPSFELPLWVKALTPRIENLGGVEVSTYEICGVDPESDGRFLKRAIEISRRCTPSPTSYCVGAVIVTSCGEIFEGYTHQTSPTHHAEQAAVQMALEAGAELRGATIYSSMEPCSTRASEPESCSQIIIRLGFRRAVFALYEPSCFVCCEGAVNMRKAGVVVEYRGDLGGEVLQVNRHLFPTNQ